MKYSYLFVFLFLISCQGNSDYVPTNTSVSIETPFPKSSRDGEIVMLLRKREAPYNAVAIRLSNDCLMDRVDCDSLSNILATFPEHLSQVGGLSWINDGSKAFIWDNNASDIYTIDPQSGTIQIFKKGIVRVIENFLVSPDGEQIVFEVSEGPYETGLVLMDVNSGKIENLEIPLVCMKFALAWIDPVKFMFRCNKYSALEGKAILESVKVFTFDIEAHSVQPFETGRDWMWMVAPVFSPNREYMAFSDSIAAVIRNVSSGKEKTLDLSAEKFLWSTDSKSLGVYSQGKEIFVDHSDGSGLEKVYSLLEDEYLEDWMWMPDNEHLLLITSDDNGNREVGVLSVLNKRFTHLNLLLLNDYHPISISFKP